MWTRSYSKIIYYLTNSCFMASFKVNGDYQVLLKILKTVNLKKNSLSFFRMEVLRLESFFHIWDKVCKNGPNKICWRQPLKKFTWSILEYIVPYFIKKILDTFSSRALWCSNNDFNALSTSTSDETPADDCACLFTTVILNERSCLDTRLSKCSSSNYWDRNYKYRLILPVLVPNEYKKLRAFQGLKAFIKPFEASQRIKEIKI